MPAFSSAGTRASACTMIGSKWSQSSLEKLKLETVRNALLAPTESDSAHSLP